ncbi:MAG TPA: HAMP domain-containing sensor histidine kinase [Candidatus Dormibacteraeota bacterium]|nr:HAMP domain-containing sensor histidine kinase [Candidatus Dormibacteraeota bacterium]
MAEDAEGLTPGSDALAAGADARLMRAVRWRLVAFSGGSTLLVLIVLGIALYVSVASSLAASSQAVLADRASELAAQMRGEPPTAGGPGFDFLFGGGTFAIAVDPTGQAYGPRQFQIPTGLPDTDAIASAKAHGSDIRTTTIAFQEVAPGQGTREVAVPVRQLTLPVDTTTGRWAVQVVQDRSTEQRTLENIVFVLVLGGLVVVLVAGAFGWVYARRALVPIRDSLAGQRVALRRQREFAADASHELRTPLTVIRASVEYLRRNPTKPVREVGDALVDIDAEVHHLTTLVDDLLLLARSDSGAVTLERVPLHLDDVATDAAAALAQPAADAGVRVEVDPEPTAAVGDPARLRQLVMILVDNAIRHSPRGGAVRVVVRPDTDGGSTLAVEDAGPGVAPEDRAHVFDRFWRAPGAPAGGTGLGLAIAKWIAEHHDGTIAVDQSAAGGARFEVHLPAGPAELRPAASA